MIISQTEKNCNLFGKGGMPFFLGLILNFGSNSAAQMPFAQIDPQNFLNALIETVIEQLETLGDVFMYGRFADFKVRSARSDGTARLDDIFAVLSRSFLNLFLHKIRPLSTGYLFLCRKSAVYVLFLRFPLQANNQIHCPQRHHQFSMKNEFI